jgi:hypothetical protein
MPASVSYHGELLDITAPDNVQIELDKDGQVLWIHVDGITVLRICRITHPVEIVDNRPQRNRKA